MATKVQISPGFHKLHSPRLTRTGNLPYWEWGHDIDDVSSSPVFDGSDTSLGSDGAPISPHPPMMLLPPGGSTNVVIIPPAGGGGCVHSGPFANMTVHLGPMQLPELGTTNTSKPLLEFIVTPSDDILPYFE